MSLVLLQTKALVPLWIYGCHPSESIMSPMSRWLTGEMGGGHEKCSARDLGISAENNLGEGGPVGWLVNLPPIS